jgi:hypothetical protein
MEMPQILACDATECAYNQNQKCHALAITVGDGDRAQCDTFWKAASKGGILSIIGGVGACRATNCRFNQDLECSARSINVGHQGTEVDCLTFRRDSYFPFPSNRASCSWKCLTAGSSSRQRLASRRASARSPRRKWTSASVSM